jgi:hypothetical protein
VSVPAIAEYLLRITSKLSGANMGVDAAENVLGTAEEMQ